MRVPLRTCVTCRQSKPKRDLIRLVARTGGAHGVVQVDPTGSRPGRGAYLCGLARCTDAALRRDGAAIRRSLRLVGDTVLDAEAIRTEVSWIHKAAPSRSREGVSA